MLKAAGFVNVEVKVKKESRDLIKKWMPGSGAENYVSSALLKATKPGDGHTSANEKARVKEFWDGILQDDEEDEPAPSAPKKASNGIFDKIREDLKKSTDHGHGAPSDHGHGAPSGHGHGAPSGGFGGLIPTGQDACCDDGV